MREQQVLLLRRLFSRGGMVHYWPDMFFSVTWLLFTVPFSLGALVQAAAEPSTDTLSDVLFSALFVAVGVFLIGAAERHRRGMGRRLRVLEYATPMPCQWHLWRAKESQLGLPTGENDSIRTAVRLTYDGGTLTEWIVRASLKIQGVQPGGGAGYRIGEAADGVCVLWLAPDDMVIIEPAVFKPPAGTKQRAPSSVAD